MWSHHLAAGFDSAEAGQHDLNHLCAIYNQAALIAYLRRNVAQARLLLDRQVDLILARHDSDPPVDLTQSLVHVCVNKVRATRFAQPQKAKQQLDAVNGALARSLGQLCAGGAANNELDGAKRDLLVEECKVLVALNESGGAARCVDIAHAEAGDGPVLRLAVESAFLLTQGGGAHRGVVRQVEQLAADNPVRAALMIHQAAAALSQKDPLAFFKVAPSLRDMAEASATLHRPYQIDHLIVSKAIGDLFWRCGKKAEARRIYVLTRVGSKHVRDLPIFAECSRHLNGFKDSGIHRGSLFPIYGSAEALERSNFPNLVNRLLGRSAVAPSINSKASGHIRELAELARSL